MGSSPWDSGDCFEPLPYPILTRAHETGRVRGVIIGKVEIEAQSPQRLAQGHSASGRQGRAHVAPACLSTALTSVEPRKGKEKGTSWLRPHSSFGEEPSLPTPVTPGGGGGYDFCLNG